MALLFRQHVPNFMSGVESKEVEYIDLAQIKEFSHIKNLMADPDFIELAKTELRTPFDDRGDFLISAFFKDSHIVVGYIRANNQDEMKQLKIVQEGMELRDWEDAKAELDRRRDELIPRFKNNWMKEDG